MKSCYHCKHYYVTWDDKFPHGCRAMQFKSKEFPAMVVFKSSGVECLLSVPKTSERQPQKPKKKRSQLYREI